MAALLYIAVMGRPTRQQPQTNQILQTLLISTVTNIDVVSRISQNSGIWHLRGISSKTRIVPTARVSHRSRIFKSSDYKIRESLLSEAGQRFCRLQPTCLEPDTSFSSRRNLQMCAAHHARHTRCFHEKLSSLL